MKKSFINKIILAVIALFGFIACQDREVITVENQFAPIVLNMSTQNVALDRNFPNNPALTVTWTRAGYSVPVEVKYKIEIATTSAFTNPYVLGTVAESQNTATFTAEQLNKAAQAIGLKTNVEATMYIRVTSYLGTVSENLLATSNVTSVKITPYALVYPDFYIVGAASYVGWDSTKAQLLYKSENMSYIYTYLASNQPFRFLGQQDWNPKNYSLNNPQIRAAYRYFSQTSSNLTLNGTDDENILFTGTTSGIYKISINATTGVQSIEATISPIPAFDFPEIYLVGSVNGWDAANAIPMTRVSEGVYTYTAKLDNGSEFKFLGQKSWSNLEWGNITKAGNSGYLGPKGDNDNIKFDGGGSNYKITVNIKAGTYTLVKQ